MLKRFVIKKTEKALLFKSGDFQRILAPGAYALFDPLNKLRIERFDLAQPAFANPVADYLMASAPDIVAQEFVRVELAETQAGLRFEDGVLVELLPPGTRRLYWKGLRDVRVQAVEIAEQVQVDAALAKRLTQTQLRARAVAGLNAVLQTTVPDYASGVLRVDGKLMQLLSPGAYAFWRFGREVSVEIVDMRLQSLEVTGQEILTKDKVALRLNLSATFKYTDVLKAFTQLNQPAEALYRELQLGLRAAVGTRLLDELLENRNVIDQVVVAAVTDKLAGYGVALQSVGVKDIILPGEMKAILAKVVEAEKTAQANNIRRREETAATRSLLNTAKVMEDNPTALRMKELETLEKIAERIDKISVFGGLDGVLNSLIKVR
ncbi:MAG: slipin family protein [Burkholderiaceae bacterium]